MQIDAKKFDKMAREVFAPVYPLIAAQAIKRTGITEGVCLDIGCGGGYLGVALAQTTDLFVKFFDQSLDMLNIVQANIEAHGIMNKTETLSGNVEAIPLPDNSVNLAISRGSMFFWDRIKAFREVHRVLAPGGMSYIGGGFGNAQIKAQIDRHMESKEESRGEWRERLEKNLGTDAPKRFEEELENAGIQNYCIEQSDEFGLWIIITK